MVQPTPGATKIMIIRHAEKPPDPPSPPPPYGVNANGTQDAESLIIQGWQRAGALAGLFAPARGPFQDPNLATPQFVYASRAVPHTDSDSMRPQETVTPLINKLGNGVSVNFEFLKGEEHAAATSALVCKGVVLICWEHKNIHKLVHEIPVSPQQMTPVPKKWDGDRYDMVWIFDLDPDTGTYLFSQVAQLLLAGDAPV
jgi:hypothetical protein